MSPVTSVCHNPHIFTCHLSSVSPVPTAATCPITCHLSLVQPPVTCPQGRHLSTTNYEFIQTSLAGTEGRVGHLLNLYHLLLHLLLHLHLLHLAHRRLLLPPLLHLVLHLLLHLHLPPPRWAWSPCTGPRRLTRSVPDSWTS